MNFLYINEASIDKKAYRPEGNLNRQFGYGDMCLGRDDSRIFLYNINMERENKFGMIL